MEAGDRDRDRVWDRRPCFVCRDADRRLRLLPVGLDDLLPYLLCLVVLSQGACCDRWALQEVLESVVVVAVDSGSCLDPPGDSGGVELVTGANTISLLILTSHWPDLLYLLASSANTT